MKFNYAFCTSCRTRHLLLKLTDTPVVCFYFLNTVRLISVVSLLLVFSSSIFVIVTDVRAVNAFLGGQTSQDMVDCDYIECVLDSILYTPITYSLSEAVTFLIKPPASSGRSLTVCWLYSKSSCFCSQKLAGP
jgi:hypothetical protein